MAFDVKSRAPCAIIYQSELDYISRCILDCKNIETGGELFGFWTASGVPVVLLAIGPGPKANHQVTFFNQDVEYLVELGQLLIAKFGLQHIGEWHSHHQLDLARPSFHDAETMASSISHRHLGRFLMGLGNCDELSSMFNAFEFVEGFGTDFRMIPWDVKEGASPFRESCERDKEIDSLMYRPQTKKANHGQMHFAGEELKTEQPTYPAGYWLNDPAYGVVLKRMIDAMPSLIGSEVHEVILNEKNEVEVCVTVGAHQLVVQFVNGFPVDPPKVRMNTGDDCMELVAPWSYNGNAESAFTQFLLQLKEIINV